jgi:hypothetical protein
MLVGDMVIRSGKQKIITSIIDSVGHKVKYII